MISPNVHRLPPTNTRPKWKNDRNREQRFSILCYFKLIFRSHAKHHTLSSAHTTSRRCKQHSRMRTIPIVRKRTKRVKKMLRVMAHMGAIFFRFRLCVWCMCERENLSLSLVRWIFPMLFFFFCSFDTFSVYRWLLSRVRDICHLISFHSVVFESLSDADFQFAPHTQSFNVIVFGARNNYCCWATHKFCM